MAFLLSALAHTSSLVPLTDLVPDSIAPRCASVAEESCQHMESCSSCGSTSSDARNLCGQNPVCSESAATPVFVGCVPTPRLADSELEWAPAPARSKSGDVGSDRSPSHETCPAMSRRTTTSDEDPRVRLQQSSSKQREDFLSDTTNLSLSDISDTDGSAPREAYDASALDREISKLRWRLQQKDAELQRRDQELDIVNKQNQLMKLTLERQTLRVRKTLAERESESNKIRISVARHLGDLSRALAERESENLALRQRRLDGEREIQQVRRELELSQKENQTLRREIERQCLEVRRALAKKEMESNTLRMQVAELRTRLPEESCDTARRDAALSMELVVLGCPMCASRF